MNKLKSYCNILPGTAAMAATCSVLSVRSQPSSNKVAYVFDENLLISSCLQKASVSNVDLSVLEHGILYAGRNTFKNFLKCTESATANGTLHPKKKFAISASSSFFCLLLISSKNDLIRGCFDLFRINTGD